MDGSARGKVRRALSGLLPGRRQPLLTVVVPVYDVERFLPECLDSIAGQPLFGDGLVDVVIVDDGSPDDSHRVAAAFADAQPDGRVRILRQSNAGLGAARNAGAAEVRTPYLTFLDSDDVLPDDAWTAMVRSLERTGSDLVIGKLVQQRGDTVTCGRLMERNHANDVFATTAIQRPLLLADVFAVNKVYRTSFWRATGLGFGVGVRYEDQPALTRALLAASAIDVLVDVVYHWRIRSDGSSITQGRGQLADIRDRTTTKLESLDAVRAYAREYGAPQVLDVFLRDVLPVDMWEYFRACVGNTDDYWAAVRTCLTSVWREVPFHRANVPAQQRVMGWLVAQDRRADLARFLEWLDSTAPRDRVRDGVLQHPFVDEPGLPAHVSRAGQRPPAR